MGGKTEQQGTIRSRANLIFKKIKQLQLLSTRDRFKPNLNKGHLEARLVRLVNSINGEEEKSLEFRRIEQEEGEE